jgi:hypothetical protein
MSLAPEGAHRLRGAKHVLPLSASTGLRKWTRAISERRACRLLPYGTPNLKGRRSASSDGLWRCGGEFFIRYITLIS